MKIERLKIRNYLKAVLIAITFCCQFPFVATAQIQPDIDSDAPVMVEQIKVQGYTIFSDREIAAVVEAYRGKRLDYTELRNITQAITELYVAKGYITSGAFLPQQEIVDGVIKVQVIEGKLERIDISGLKNLQENYVRSFISSAKTSPQPTLNIKTLEDNLKLLRQDASIKNIKAELVRGTQPHLSVLLLEVEEVNSFETRLSFDNYRSPSIGELQGTVAIGYRNLIGISDRFSAQYNLTEGFDAYSLNYILPFNSQGGGLSLEYRDGDSKIIEVLEEAGIRAEYDTFSLQYRQPLVYQPEREIAVGIGFAKKNSETFILDDEPYSFVTGSAQNRSETSVLKLTGDWLERSQSAVFAINSEINIGLDIFDATFDENSPDGIFFSWFSQAQWTQALNQDRDLLLVTRLTTQLTPDSLLPIEQFTLGGAGTVRGYRQNQEIGDNGVVGTIEIYVPLISDRFNNYNLNLIPFFDGGTVWNNSNNEGEALASLGIGLNWQFKEWLSVRVDWGLPLINRSDRGDSLQDNGFTFFLQLQPF